MEPLSDIEKIILSQQWKNKSRSIKQSPFSMSPMRIGPIYNKFKSTLTFPQRSSVNLAEKKPTCKNFIESPDDANRSRLEDLKRLAVPYKVLFEAIAKVTIRKASIHMIPAFPMRPFGTIGCRPNTPKFEILIKHEVPNNREIMKIKIKSGRMVTSKSTRLPPLHSPKTLVFPVGKNNKYSGIKMITKRLFSISVALKSASAHKDALHFTDSPYRWSFKEVNRFSEAYAVGLLEMGLKPGDSLSTWISCSEAAESYMVHLACYRAGIKVFALSSEADLEKALSSTSALVFSPWEDTNGFPRIDKVLDKVPTLLTTPTGSFVKSPHATKYFIQSGFKTIRGTYKLKSIPVYSPLINPVDSFTYTYKGITVQNDDFAKFAKDFSGKIVEGDRIVNGVACKEAFGFASVAAAIKMGVKSVSAVLGDSSAAVSHHNANVLILTESKIAQIAEPCEVDKILIGIEKKEDLERVKALLEKKSVKAKIVFPYQIGNLSSLA